MRKQTKIVAALSATALLALGASAVTFAAGWDNSTGSWQYLDNDGSAVSDVWKKSGNYWFYLGSDGNMTTDALVEYKNEYYYVNAEGAMVTNQWVALDTDGYDSSSDDGEAEYRWYYFGSDGKAYRDKGSEAKLTTSDLKTINGKKYAFDQDGKMLYGWVDAEGLNIEASDDDSWQNADYYFGGWNDGSAQTGWAQLTVDTTSISDDDDTDTYWFYMDSNGKIQKNKKKTINGATYYFDEYGRMVDDWADASAKKAVDSTSSSNNIIYTNGDGSVRKNQWVWAVPAEDQVGTGTDYDDDEYSWWWTKADGKLFTNGIKKIKGKYYIFDKAGRMLSGLVISSNNHTNASEKYDGTDLEDYNGDVFAALPLSGYTIEYYSDNEEKDGSRKTGYQTVEFDDDSYQMYFNTSNGKAENGYVSKIKKYCANGIVLKANNDTSNYGVIYKSGSTIGTTVEYVEATDEGLQYVDGNHILVNAAGTVQKNKANVKDNNDVYYFTDANGYVVYAGAKLTSSKTSATDYDKTTNPNPTVVLTYKNTKYYVAE